MATGPAGLPRRVIDSDTRVSENVGAGIARVINEIVEMLEVLKDESLTTK